MQTSVTGVESAMQKGCPLFNPAGAPPPFTLRTTLQPNRHVRVALGGELDISTVGLIGPAIDAIIRIHRPAAVDIDLTYLHFISCCGVNTLIKARQRALQADCRLILTHPQPTVLRILALTGAWGTLHPALAPCTNASSSRALRSSLRKAAGVPKGLRILLRRAD